MRKKRRSNHAYQIDRRLLFGLIGIIVLLVATISVNSEVPFQEQSLSAVQNETVPVAESPDNGEQAENPEVEFTAAEAGNTSVLSDQLWADVGEDITTPRATHNSTDRISINVKDANLLDVLSMLAYKMGVNVIFLEEPSQITLKTDTLSPITTFQIVLQKEGLDYLTLGKNYIVGNRDRLYGDFTNRMFLSRYDLFYVSASDMESYIEQLGMPVQSLSVDSNQKALWMQGTPMTLGKARELINTLDVIDNASFAEGGGRKIRMPVATATGTRAQEELEALVDLLSILLDGFRDGRTDMGWVTWDHPDPVPSIYMDWDSPIIKPYDIKMKVTRDFANNSSGQIRYLIAEGTPDNIELVNQMIQAISGAPATPFTFEIDDEEIEAEGADSVQWVPDNQQQQQQQSTPARSYTVSVSGVPSTGGIIDGAGSYTEGSSVTVKATPVEGYEFVRWIEGGSEISTSESYSFTIYGNRNFEAVFITSSSEEAISEDENSEASD